MESLVENVRIHFKTLPKNRLYLYIFLLVAIVGGSIIGLSFIQKESYQTLFTGLSTEDASMVVAKLKEQKIPYRLGMGGAAIQVPKDKVYDVRLVLASQNSLPGAGGVGYELFDKTNYGMTEFMQNINYKRAIQGELSRTINQMPEVKGSRVHIAIPEKTIFSDREREVTASVFLRTKPGRNLSKEQVAGVVHLVAGSIEGLRPENVVVVDASGKILHKNGDVNSPVVLSGHQFELQRNVERKVEDSIQSMLDRFIPSSKSIVRATVDLNFRKVEKVEEEYLPNKSAITSERKSKEKSASQSAKASGIPGVASNVPAAGREAKQDGAGTGKGGNESEREEAQVSYEVSKTVRKIVEPFGDIKRISVAVVVDGKYEKTKGQKGEELKYVPRPQKELGDIKSLVARAVGFDEERGDKIEVLNVPFEVENVADEKALVEKAERKEMIFDIAKYAFYLVILVSVFLFLVRPLMGMLKGKEGVARLNEIRDVYVKTDKTGAPDAIESKPAQPPALVSALKDRALVGAVIREWVKEGS
jgi:flagellar M-ring protein FliF